MAMVRTRMDGLPRRWRWALLGLVVVAMLLLVAVALTRAPALPPADVVAPAVAAEGDLATYERIIARMRSGEAYYPAAHEVLVADGYGTRSVFNWRTPAWPVILALLPPGGGQMLLGLLAVVALLLGYRALRPEGPAVAAVSLLAVALSVGSVLVPESALFAEVPAGLLILISVAAYAGNWRLVGLIAAMLALFLRELAAPYVLVAVLLAIRGHHWREFAAWCGALIAYGLYFAWHWWQVLGQLGPMDRGYDEGWIAFGGLGFVLDTAGFNGLWSLGPDWLPALLLPLGLFGLWAWPNGRALVATCIYVAAFLVVGKPFNAYWGAVYTPLLMLGLGWVWPAARAALVKP